MNTTYTQCLLKRGKSTQTSWIPGKFAHIGKFVKLKDEDGWKVCEVFSTESEEYLLKHERDYKTQRLASDI